MATDSPEFISYFRGKNGLLNDVSYDIFMGHCRAATYGNISNQNAHPFDTHNLVGAHNGTLMDKEFIDPKGRFTDSELMFRKMSQKGVDTVLNSLHWGSAWAVSIYDKQSKKLILGRNADRPLFVGFHDEGVLSWASELRMLTFTADRLKQDITTYMLERNKLYIIDIDKIKRGVHNPWDIVEVKQEVDDGAWERYLASKYGTATNSVRDDYGYSTDYPEVEVKEGPEKPKKTNIQEVLDEVMADLEVKNPMDLVR